MVDRDRIREDLAMLVATPSVTGAEREAQDEIGRRMSEAGLRVERIEADPAELAQDPDWPGSEVERDELPVVAGHLDTGRPGPRVLLIGHVDVVPPGDPAAWTTPAFYPAVRDGNLYGRGACDMKGGLVAALEAVRILMSSGADLAGEAVVLAVPSEEDGGAGALAAIRAGYTGDLAVITEPTRLEVVVAHAGAITFSLSVPGKAAHAATRREGVSALDLLSYLVGALAEDERRRNEEESDPLMRAIGLAYPTIVGRVRGGDWASTVMDRVVADGRYGVRLGQTCDEAEAELRAAVEAAWTAHEWLARHPVGLEVWGGRFGTARIDPGHSLPTSLADAAERVTGSRPPMVGVPYGADMRLFTGVGGTPTVMYGPGDVRVAHSADEHVPLAEVETGAAVLASWLGSVMGT